MWTIWECVNFVVIRLFLVLFMIWVWKKCRFFVKVFVLLFNLLRGCDKIIMWLNFKDSVCFCSIFLWMFLLWLMIIIWICVFVVILIFKFFVLLKVLGLVLFFLVIFFMWRVCLMRMLEVLRLGYRLGNLWVLWRFLDLVVIV